MLFNKKFFLWILVLNLISCSSFDIFDSCSLKRAIVEQNKFCTQIYTNINKTTSSSALDSLNDIYKKNCINYKIKYHNKTCYLKNYLKNDL